MFAACLWQRLSELWVQGGGSSGGTAGGLASQWRLNKGAIQIGIHRHSRESRQPEDWELKQDVCRGGKEGVCAEHGAVGGQASMTSSPSGVVDLPCLWAGATSAVPLETLLPPPHLCPVIGLQALSSRDRQ